jgi:hypothetical protein
MTPKHAVLRLALLIVVGFAVSANGALVFAQPGSTGGTVGKAQKSLSGGQEAASPAQRSSEKSHTNGRKTKSDSQLKHVTRNSERSPPTRSPASADQDRPTPGGHGGGSPAARCHVIQVGQFGGMDCD